MSKIDMSLLPDFIVEAEEHLQEMEALLLKLVQEPHNLELLNDIFRPIHTIKGGSQYIGLEKISRLAHQLEDLLDQLRDGSRASSPEIIEVLIAATDRIVALVHELEQQQTEISEIDDLVEKLQLLLGAEAAKPEATEAPALSQVDTAAVKPASSYAAEEDEELYSIFIAHLKEQMAEFNAMLQQADPNQDMEAVLKRSTELLASMRGSANYMDYVELVHHFQIWASELEDALQQLRQGSAVSLAFMAVRINELGRLFPELEGGVDSQVWARWENPTAQPSMAETTHLDASSGPQAGSAQVEEDASDEIDMELLPDFIIEANEHLNEMESLLLGLMLEPDSLEVLNEIFRSVHSIKGGAQYLRLKRIARLTHVLEDLLDLLRGGRLESNNDIVELLIAGRDRMLNLVQELEASHEESTSVEDLVIKLQSYMPPEAVPESGPEPVAAVIAQEAAAGAALTPYEEDEDKELYSIFIEHLREQFGLFLEQADLATNSDDPAPALEQCRKTLAKMCSSANYMDYAELVHRYKQWMDELEQLEGRVRQGERPVLGTLATVMAELPVLFPQLSSLQGRAGEESQFRVILNEPVAGGLDDTLAKRHTDEPSAASMQKAADEQLFQSLSGALERSLSPGKDGDVDTLHQIFDELVSGQKGKGEQAPAKSESRTPAQAVKQREKQASRSKREGTESKVRKSVRVDADKIDSLMNQVGELVVDRSYFFQMLNEMRNLQRHLKDVLGLDQREVKMMRNFTYRLGEAIASLGRTSNELQEGVMKMRMLPISQIFNRYPRLVHDLTRGSEKQVNLVVKGEDTELDRMIVEELSDPLIHIIRNSVDHGLETADERRTMGKEEEGTLVLEAYQESNHIVIEVTDDGRGMNPGKIRQKAIEKRLYNAEELERFSDDEILSLVMMPGFSTADKITGTSGRGVGMDVVKKNIEKLNGTLEIESKLGVGTQIRLKIPLTLAIIHALMVRVGGDLFTIPLANVDETVRIFKADTSTVEGVEVIHLRGQTLPIFRLTTLFDLTKRETPDKSFVVIVSVGGQRTGFVVDELLGQEEVVIKPLADYVQDKSGFSGATIIGDGRISLILDVYEMVRMTANKQALKQKEQTAQLKSKMRRRGTASVQNAGIILPE